MAKFKYILPFFKVLNSVCADNFSRSRIRLFSSTYGEAFIFLALIETRYVVLGVKPATNHLYHNLRSTNVYKCFPTLANYFCLYLCNLSPFGLVFVIPRKSFTKQCTGSIVKLGSWSWSMVLVKFKIHDQKRTRDDAIIQMHHPPTTKPPTFQHQYKGPEVMSCYIQTSKQPPPPPP